MALGPKWGKKWPKNGEKMGFGVIFLFFRHFWAIFSPFRAEGHFLCFVQFFPIFGFRRVFHSIPGSLTRNSIGCLASLPGNQPFRPFAAFCALFRKARRACGKSIKHRKTASFLRCPRICLNPHLLTPMRGTPKFDGTLGMDRLRLLEWQPGIRRERGERGTCYQQ